MADTGKYTDTGGTDFMGAWWPEPGQYVTGVQFTGNGTTSVADWLAAKRSSANWKDEPAAGKWVQITLDLNRKAGGNTIYMQEEFGTDPAQALIAGCITRDGGCSDLSSYWSGVPADHPLANAPQAQWYKYIHNQELNKKAGGKDVYFRSVSNRHNTFQKKPLSTDPWVALIPVWSDSKDVGCPAWTRNMSTSGGATGELNEKAGGSWIRLCSVPESTIMNCCLKRSDASQCHSRFYPDNETGKNYCDRMVAKWCSRPENKGAEECGCFQEPVFKKSADDPSGVNEDKMAQVFGGRQCWFTPCTRPKAYIPSDWAAKQPCKSIESYVDCSIVNSPVILGQVAGNAAKAVQANVQQCQAQSYKQQATDLASKPNSIVRCASTGKVYKIEGGQKRWFSEAGYKAAGSPKFQDYDCRALDQIPDGPTIEAAPTAPPAPPPGAGTGAPAPTPETEQPPAADSPPAEPEPEPEPESPPPEDSADDADTDADTAAAEKKKKKQQEELMLYLGLGGGGLVFLLLLILLLK